MNFEVTPLPTFKEVKGKDYVYCGDDNLFFDYLIDLCLKSARHGAIINGKINYIYGKGLTFSKDGLTPDKIAIANAFIKFLNKKNGIRKIISDFEMFNAVSLEIIYNKKKTKISEINHIPFNKLRTNVDEDKYYYSNNWKARVQDDDTGYKEFDVFDEDTPVATSIFVYKVISPIKTGEPNVYPIPEYQGATIAIETDIAIANFDNSNLSSGFTAGTIINFNNGVPATDKAKEDIEVKVKEKGTGANNAGRVFLSFNNGKDKETTVTTITPSDLDKQNVEVDKRTEQRIFTGHKIINPALFGVKTEGQLGGRNEIIDSYELFQSTYVDVRQGMLEEIINMFARIYGVSAKITFDRVTPVSQQIDSSVISAAYTQNEVREMLGLHVSKTEKTDKSKEIINSLNSLSPLVANKVLEKLSDTEIRSLIGLSSAAPITTSNTTSLYNKENVDVIETVFAKYGKSKQDFEIVEVREFDFISYEATVISEYKFKSELNEIERSIISLVEKDNKIDIQGIAKALNKGVGSISPIYNSLIEGGYLKVKGDITKPTSPAKEIVKEDAPKIDNYEVLYGYDWRKGFGNSDKKNSRDFCKRLLEKDLLYTRSEIDLMNNEMGTDVWTFKGGWYTKPDSNSRTPYCRHTWHQFLVKKK